MPRFLYCFQILSLSDLFMVGKLLKLEKFRN